MDRFTHLQKHETAFFDEVDLHASVIIDGPDRDVALQNLARAVKKLSQITREQQDRLNAAGIPDDTRELGKRISSLELRVDNFPNELTLR